MFHFLLVLFVATAAQATPEVGDYVKFTEQFKGPDGETGTVKFSREILSYNSDTGDFSIRFVETYPDETSQITEYEWPQELFTSDTEIETTLTNCKDLGGEIEYLQIGSEKLKSCRIENFADGETTVDWHAHVPFGIAKYSSHIRYGRGLTATVVDFVRGGK